MSENTIATGHDGGLHGYDAPKERDWRIDMEATLADVRLALRDLQTRLHKLENRIEDVNMRTACIGGNIDEEL